MDRNYIVELIKDSRLQEAIKALEKATQGSHLHNDLISLSARYAEYTRLNRNATEDFQTLEMQRAKITNSLLSILDEVSSEDLETLRHNTAPTTPSVSTLSTLPFNRNFLYGIIGVLVLGIIYFAFFRTAPETVVTEQQDLTINIHKIEYSDGNGDIGHFIYEDEVWHENNGDNKMTFKEINRENNVIFLRDDSRNMNIELDLGDSEIRMHTDKDSTSQLLYHIKHFE
ncbi:MAG: hypothetical protein JNL70_01300 [Saprospiraceae bacterium]|nr:hypothetical protein [Saprospiraceae bacterium]